MFEIQRDDLSHPAVLALVAYHVAQARGNSPPDQAFALDVGGLQAPEVTVWTAWQGELVAGIGALKRLGDGTAEIKSMRTHPDFLRQGVAGLLLDHILREARGLGLARLSLETGRGPAFEPALALYRNRGFVQGAAFSGYAENDFSQFFHLDLA